MFLYKPILSVVGTLDTRFAQAENKEDSLKKRHGMEVHSVIYEEAALTTIGNCAR